MSAATDETRPAGGEPVDRETWLTKGERGAMLGIRLVLAVATLLGRWPARQFIRLIALWYRLFDRSTVRASSEYLCRLHGREPTWGEVYQHILRFSQCALDRIFLLKGKDRLFTITRTGNHHLAELVERGEGAILLGAHLGSFEAMRLDAVTIDVPINILGHFDNAKMVNALFKKMNPDMAARVIHVGDDPIGVMMKVREAIDRGELVAVLGDRVGLGDKFATARFLGGEAKFATGPFLMAALLKCPVYLTFGLHHPPNRYDLYCEPFADPIHLPRARRQEALEEVVQLYADRLEDYCRKAPDNWFNFFDFWEAA